MTDPVASQWQREFPQWQQPGALGRHPGYGHAMSSLRASRIGFLEVFARSLRVGFHGWVTLLPVSGAHFAVGLELVQRIDEAQGFVYATAQWQVIDQHVPKNACLVDQEQATQGNAFVGEKNTVILGNALGEVSNKGVPNATETTLSTGRLVPGQVRELAVHRDAKNFCIALLEFSKLLIESNDFGWANKGEVEGVKEEDNVLAKVIVEVDGFELVSHNGSGSEHRCRLGDKRAHDGLAGFKRKSVKRIINS